jgi:hypothetical protein
MHLFMHRDASIKGFFGQPHFWAPAAGREYIWTRCSQHCGCAGIWLSYKIPYPSQLADYESLDLLEYRYSRWLLFREIPSSFTDRLL